MLSYVQCLRAFCDRGECEIQYSRVAGAAMLFVMGLGSQMRRNAAMQVLRRGGTHFHMKSRN